MSGCPSPEMWIMFRNNLRDCQRRDQVLLLFFSQLYILECFWNSKDEELWTNTGKRKKRAQKTHESPLLRNTENQYLLLLGIASVTISRVEVARTEESLISPSAMRRSLKTKKYLPSFLTPD